MKGQGCGEGGVRDLNFAGSLTAGVITGQPQLARLRWLPRLLEA